MHSITDRQQRIWENIYAMVFTQHLQDPKGQASVAHDSAKSVADNAIGRLIADALPSEQMPEAIVDRFVKSVYVRRGR